MSMKRNLEPFEHINEDEREILLCFKFRYLYRNIRFNFEQREKENVTLLCYSEMDTMTLQKNS